MVSKSSYDELLQAYEERGALLFESIHLLNQTLKDHWEVEDQLDLLSEIEDFLSRARLAGMA